MEKEKYEEALKFFEERKNKMEIELENPTYSQVEKEIIQINISMDNITIRALKEYMAGF